jgi:ketosteroid isomerase-like protein
MYYYIMKNIRLYVLFVTLVSCSHIHSRDGVERAMQQYDHLIKEMDADSIALLYTPDGDLGDVAHGRDSIRKFLSSFKNVKVLSQSSTTTFLEVHGDSFFQKGTYKQVVLMEGKDTVRVKGEYNATWLWIPNDGWHIKHMTTKPTN